MLGTAAEAVGNVLASTMGVSFPESFYERLSKEPEPVPLGGSSDAKSQSRETQPTAVHTSASNIHNYLFHSVESYPHAVMVKAYTLRPMILLSTRGRCDC